MITEELIGCFSELGLRFIAIHWLLVHLVYLQVTKLPDANRRSSVCAIVLAKVMAAAPRVALVLTAPVALSTLATVAVYEAVPAGHEVAATCRSPVCYSTPTPAGYQPVPADIDRSHQFLRSLQALELCKLCPSVVLAAGRADHVFIKNNPHGKQLVERITLSAVPARGRAAPGWLCKATRGQDIQGPGCRSAAWRQAGRPGKATPRQAEREPIAVT